MSLLRAGQTFQQATQGQTLRLCPNQGWPKHRPDKLANTRQNPAFAQLSIQWVAAEFARSQSVSSQQGAKNVQASQTKHISGDKAKTQTYCQIAKISVQVDQAAQEKDRKTAEELVQKINELEKQLGPEYLALVDALFDNKNIDLNSEDFEEIVSMFDRFDEACRQ